MGSNAGADDQLHPPSSSPLITLTHPTPAELPKISALSHPNWGPALTLQTYIDREAYLTTVPLSKNGGITHWLLTLASSPPGSERPILASCESIKKRAFYTTPWGEVREGIAHGVASVFTDPQYRGRGYASRMMADVGEKLKTWQSGGEERPVVLSVLYSDIGKGFYAKHGWAPFQSSHVSWRPAESSGERAAKVRTIGYHELAELCAVDERLLKERLAKMAKADGGKKRHVALAPELDQLLWHMMREDFMTKHIFGKTPEVRGAVYGEKGKRVWAVWTRGYYSLEKTAGNIFHVLRVVVEDEDNTPEGELVAGFKAIVEIARAEAKEWRSEDIQMWNPTTVVKKLVEKIGVEYEFIERDSKSIASLRWYGKESTEEIDWVANEKYAWC